MDRMSQIDLIAEIVRRVEKRLYEISCDDKKTDESKLLIVGLPHHEQGEQLRELIGKTNEIQRAYNIDYALYRNFEVDPTEYDYIVVEDLGITALSKLTQGIFDSPYLRLLSKIVLTGRQWTVVREDMEIFNYEETAPQSFMQIFKNSVKLIEDWGADIIPRADVIEKLKRNEKSRNTIDWTDHKVLSEDCLSRLWQDNGSVDKILVARKSIVSDLAKEFAEKKSILIIREGTEE